MPTTKERSLWHDSAHGNKVPLCPCAELLNKNCVFRISVTQKHVCPKYIKKHCWWQTTNNVLLSHTLLLPLKMYTYTFVVTYIHASSHNPKNVYIWFFLWLTYIHAFSHNPKNVCIYMILYMLLLIILKMCIYIDSSYDLLICMLLLIILKKIYIYIWFFL